MKCKREILALNYMKEKFYLFSNFCFIKTFLILEKGLKIKALRNNYCKISLKQLNVNKFLPKLFHHMILLQG